MDTVTGKNKNKKLSHAEISQNRANLEGLSELKRMPVVVLLNSIRSAYNVGSVFRTSDGAMIEKLYLCGYTTSPENKDVLKTALGSDKSIPWEYVKEAEGVISSYKDRGYKIVALELTDTSVPYYKISSDDFPFLLIIGNEITGVSQNLLDMCDFSIEIPQFGIKQSLNVAVAYGIALFEFRKNWDLKN
ncbi:MAG: RNA methyltransferase [Ignavibacteriaceae bacterium]|nr:RNA methyltransferase [Ignavibacteriaceae bacterium]